METEGAAAAEIPEAAAAAAPAASPVVVEDEPVIIQVVLKGGSPWGFSLKGGAEHHCPLAIAKLEPGGKAYQSDQLQCGDHVLAVNDVQCNSHTEAIQLVKSAFNTLQLSIIRGSPGDYKHGVKNAEYYHSAQLYSKDVPPHHGHEVLPEPTKTAPTGGVSSGVTRRLKKRDSTNSPRPKSWHNAEASQHWKEREFNQQQIQQQPPPVAMMHQQVPRPVEAPSYGGYPGQPRLDTAPSMDNLTMQGSGGGGVYPNKTLRSGPNTQSMMSLHHSEKLEFAPGYMKRSITEFGSAQDMNYYTKNREFAQSYYGNKRAPFMSVNPEFRRVDLSPAETYPKVAVATQLQSAQQRAFIGRVPDAKEVPHDQQVQTFTTSRVVSYSTVQMPQRQYASTAELQTNGNNGNTHTQYHPGYSSQPNYNPTQTLPSYGSEQVSPTQSDKKAPPPLPVRGESRNRTLQISEQIEHMKSSSWPVTTENSDTYVNEAPTSVISPTNLPPVKLSPSQEYPQRKSSSNSSSSVGSIPMENNYTGDELRASLKSPSQGVYTAQPYYIDDSNNTDMDSWFSNSPEQKDSQEHNQRYSYNKEQNPPSPPTRDIDPQRSSGNSIRRERRPTADSLTGAYQTYLEEMLDQEEQLNNVDPPEVFPPSGHSSGFSSAIQSPDPLSQTAPPVLGSRHAPLRRMQAADPTNPTNRWTEERNKKNNLIGQIEQERSWQSPADFKQSTVIAQKQEETQQQRIEQKDEEWKRLVKTADSAWDDKQKRKEPAAAAVENSFSSTHKKEISEIDMTSLNINAPRMRSPINKTLSDAVGSKEDISSKSFSRMIEENGKNTKKESRDVRNSGGYEMDTDNPFKKSDRPTDIAETFSSEDWRKMSEIQSGNSILSQLRNSQTPFSSKYVNGEPVVSPTDRGKADQKPAAKSGSRSAEHSPNASSDRSWLEKRTNKSKIEPPELPPRSKASQKPFHREVPPVPTQSDIKPSVSSSAHYRAESFDLDLRTSTARPSYPAKRSDMPSEDNGNTNNSTIAHTRAHSFTAGYQPPSPYGVPPENRCTSIPEERVPEAQPADVPPPLPPRNLNMKRETASKSEVPSSRPGSTEELTKTRSEREKRLSDPRAPEPIRRSSRHSDPRGYWSQHQYSKSDSEKHQRVPISESWHKMSDPSGAIRKTHKVSDPDEKRKVQEALRKFYHEKTNSQDSGVGSRPNSVSDYGDHYSSMSSISSMRPGSVPADSLNQHHRQSVFSSQTSLSSVTSSVYRDSRDSGISSPNPGNWSQHSPPQMANIPSPEYERHHPPIRHSTSSLPDGHHREGSEPRTYDHRNPPWLSSEIQSSRKSTPVTRSSSMTVKPGLRDDRDYTRRSYEGNLGLSRTDSFTAYKSPSRSGSDQSSDSSQQDRKRRRSREERRSRAERREERISKEEGSFEKNRWSPPKPSPLAVDRSDQSKPPLSEIQTQVQQAERKTISKVDHILVSDEDDEELVQVEENIKAQKAASLQAMKTQEEPGPIFRFPSPPLQLEENERTKSSKESPLKESLSLPTPPPSPPSTHHHLAESSLPKELPSVQNLTSPSSSPPPPPLPPPTKKPLGQTDSFVLPPPPSPAHEGSIYIDNDMDFPLPPPPELLLSQDFTRFSPKEGALSSAPQESTQEPSVLIEESVCHKQTSESVESTPTSHPSKPVVTPRQSLSPQSSIVEFNAQASSEIKLEPRAPHAWIEDSDIDSDTVDDGVDSVEEADEIVATPKRTEPISPIYIPDDVSEPQHEVRVIERPTELPLLSPSPRKTSLPGEQSPDGLRAISPTSQYQKDTYGSSDSGISSNPIVDFVLKSLTPCEASDLIDLFPVSEREKNSNKKNKMPNAGDETIPCGTPKKADTVDGQPLQTMIPSSLYLQLSPAKALLLTRAKGMPCKDEIGEDNAELRKTKEELVTRISRKVEELRSLHKEVQEEITVIEDIGKDVSTKAKKKCKASEFNRYTMYVEDVDRVTRLLLSLSRRLAKVESVLSSLDNQDEEQNADLQTMKQNLERKYNDAKMLKKSIDRRHGSILTMLKKYLEEEDHEDFCHFIRMSPRQHIMAQELDDKIQLGEEQLQALTDSLKKISSTDS